MSKSIPGRRDPAQGPSSPGCDVTSQDKLGWGMMRPPAWLSQSWGALAYSATKAGVQQRPWMGGRKKTQTSDQAGAGKDRNLRSKPFFSS